MSVAYHCNVKSPVAVSLLNRTHAFYSLQGVGGITQQGRSLDDYLPKQIHYSCQNNLFTVGDDHERKIIPFPNFR
jgi:hypothetical protein